MPVSRARGWALSLLGLSLFVGGWQGLSTLGLLNPLLAPPPSAIPGAFLKELASGQWTRAVLDSLGHYLAGLAIGAPLGVLFGMAAGLSRGYDAAQLWVMRLLRPIPTLAWIPFAILWFGVSEAGATFIIAIYVFWINYFSAYGAARAVDPDQRELASAFGHRGIAAHLVKIILPSAGPALMNGLRAGIGQAWMAVVAAEIFGVPGIGQRMMDASTMLATPIVLVYMLTIAGLYGLADALHGVATRVMLPWTRS